MSTIQEGALLRKFQPLASLDSRTKSLVDLEQTKIVPRLTLNILLFEMLPFTVRRAYTSKVSKIFLTFTALKTRFPLLKIKRHRVILRTSHRHYVSPLAVMSVSLSMLQLESFAKDVYIRSVKSAISTSMLQPKTMMLANLTVRRKDSMMYDIGGNRPVHSMEQYHQNSGHV